MRESNTSKVGIVDNKFSIPKSFDIDIKKKHISNLNLCVHDWIIFQRGKYRDLYSAIINNSICKTHGESKVKINIIC